jgi:hypothetical protein
MKLEYLEHTEFENPEYPMPSILRLYAFEPPEVIQLIEIFGDLAENPVMTVQLDKLPFIQSISSCQLLLRSGESDLGIAQLAGQDNSFECTLTADGWRHAAYFAEPFTVKNKPHTYQWLYDDLETPIEIEFLLSPTGEW